MTQKIILSEEISSVFPKSENEQFELETLEKSLIENGCRMPLTVWEKENILVDGYRRYELCIKHSIPFKIEYLSFSSIEQIKSWVILNQLSRRNLSKWQCSMLAATFRSSYYEKLAQKNRKLSKGRGKKGKKESAKPFKKIDVTAELAKEAGVSRDTMLKARYILKKGDDELRNLLDRNETSINKVYSTLRKRKKTIARSQKDKVRLGYINDLSKGVENQILCLDAFEGLKLIDNGSVTLFNFSPPFNVGMNYKCKDFSDLLPRDEYLNWLKEIFEAIMPKLRKGGRLVVEIENTRAKNEKGKNTSAQYSNEADLINIAVSLGYIYRCTIKWNKNTTGKHSMPIGSYGSPSNPCMRNTHSNVIVFSKDQLDLPCITGDPSFLEGKYYDQLTQSVWDIFPEKHGYGTHCCPMPVELAKRVIELWTYEGDLVCDLFGGSGTNAVACLRTGRRFIHIDASETFCAEAKQRIELEKSKLQQKKIAA